MLSLLLFIFLAVSIFFPSSVYPWSGVIVQSIVFIFLVLSLIPHTDKFKSWHPITTAFLIYILLSAISMLNAFYLNGSWHGWFILLVGFLIYWFSATDSISQPVFHKYSARNFIGIGLVLLGVIEAGLGIYQYVYGFNYTIQLISQNPDLVSSQFYSGILHALQTHRIIGTFGNPNVYAVLLAMILPISVGYFLKYQKLTGRILFLVSSALISTALAFTYSRGGMICAIFGLIPFAFAYKAILDKRQLIWISGLILVTVIFIYASSQFPKAELTAEKLESFSARLTIPTSTVSERLHYWTIAKNMILDHPILGTGISSFGIRYGKYKPVGISETKYAHNVFLQIWVEQGLIGLLGFIGLLIGLFYFAIHYLRKSELNLGYASFGALLAFITDGLFGFGYYTPELFYLFCFILGYFVRLIKPDGLASETNETKKNRSLFFIIPSSFLLLLLTGIWYFAVYSPYLGQLYFNTALAHLKSNRLIPAVAGYKAAIVCEPANSEYHQHLGNTLLQLNQVDQGIRQLELAVKLNPHTAYYHSDLAEAYRLIGSYPEAEREVQLAISNYPNKPAYHYQLAQIYAEQGKEVLATQEMLRFAELSK
jgi:O-antigen ligase